jgi:cobalamin biosynthesis protein CobT
VNHSKIKKLIYQKQKTIKDRQFFASRIFAGHLEDIAAAQTRRYGVRRKVKVRTVWEPKNGQIACTNNNIVWINAGHKSITAKKSREERYELIMGIFAHELGHILYTDFLIPSVYAQYFKTERWYPEPPPLLTRDDRMNESDIRHFCKDDEKRTALFLKLAFHLCNILEDGYVEGKILNRYPGVLGSNLTIMREDDFESMGTLTQLSEYEADGGHIWLTLESLFLSYAKYGELKYGDEPLSDKRIQIVFSLLNELDEAVTNPSAKERWNVVNIIMVGCWEYVKDFIELYIEKADEAAASGGGASVEEMLADALASLAGTSSEGSGDTAPVEDAEGSTGTAPEKARRQITAKMAAKSSTSDDEDEKESDAGTPCNEETEDESGDESENSSESAGELENESESEEIVPPTQNVTPEESGRIPLEQTDDLYNPSGGQTEKSDDYEGGGYTNAAADIERLLENMAERAVHNQLEKERLSNVNELAQNISYGNIHDGVSKTVHRITEVSDELKEMYWEIAAPLLHISKLLQRSIKQQLQDKRNGGKQTGLIMGRRLHAPALSRNDGRVFYKNSLPNNTPEISIGLLLDESGSMASCDRATYARAAAIILYDFCKALEIPVMVYGHSASCGVDLYSYAEFEAIGRDDCYRLMDISARSNNRDGAALRFVAEQLSKRHEDIRILILVSDGQPADTGYGGTAAEEDLRGIKNEYARKGILFIAAAIGSDKENIERIYGDSFLDITDLTKLPYALTNVIKRHIRV